MIRIALVGDIGSGKSYVAKNFGYPVFNADREVGKLYKTNKKIFKKLKKNLPKYFNSFPIDKNDVSRAILDNNFNLKKIIKIIHLEIRKKMKLFLNENKDKKITILDIPLFLENKIDKKSDVIVFIQSKKIDVQKRLRKRKNFNKKIYRKFKKIQLSLDQKKRKSRFIIKNNFTKISVKRGIKEILNEIL